MPYLSHTAQTHATATPPLQISTRSERRCFAEDPCPSQPAATCVVCFFARVRASARTHMAGGSHLQADMPGPNPFLGFQIARLQSPHALPVPRARGSCAGHRISRRPAAGTQALSKSVAARQPKAAVHARVWPCRAFARAPQPLLTARSSAFAASWRRHRAFWCAQPTAAGAHQCNLAHMMALASRPPPAPTRATGRRPKANECAAQRPCQKLAQPLTPNCGRVWTHAHRAWRTTSASSTSGGACNGPLMMANTSLPQRTLHQIPLAKQQATQTRLPRCHPPSPACQRYGRN